MTFEPVSMSRNNFSTLINSIVKVIQCRGTNSGPPTCKTCVSFLWTIFHDELFRDGFLSPDFFLINFSCVGLLPDTNSISLSEIVQRLKRFASHMALLSLILSTEPGVDLPLKCLILAFLIIDNSFYNSNVETKAQWETSDLQKIYSNLWHLDL